MSVKWSTSPTMTYIIHVCNYYTVTRILTSMLGRNVFYCLSHYVNRTCLTLEQKIQLINFPSSLSSLFVSFFVYVSLSLSLSLFISLSVCLCLSLCLCLSVSFSACQSLSRSVSLCMCMCLSLSPSLPLSLSFSQMSKRLPLLLFLVVRMGALLQGLLPAG